MILITMSNESNAQQVKQFTEQANGITCPQRPFPMTREETLFIARMIISEVDELLCTVSKDANERDQLMTSAMQSRDPCTKFMSIDACPLHVAAEQGDALVDAWYYSLNAAAKKGINLSRIFDVVHGANMAKRDPETGQFLRRTDGKIMKPKGWQAPDINAELER